MAPNLHAQLGYPHPADISASQTGDIHKMTIHLRTILVGASMALALGAWPAAEAADTMEASTPDLATPTTDLGQALVGYDLDTQEPFTQRKSVPKKEWEWLRQGDREPTWVRSLLP
jgi:hypothetical protein